MVNGVITFFSNFLFPQTPIQQRLKLASSLDVQVRLREVPVESIEAQQQIIDELIILEEVI